MRLLVIKVLNAMLDAAQKIVSACECVGCVLRHQAGFGEALQRVNRAAGAQLGVLPTAHHLKQLHGKFDFTNAAARYLHVVGPFGMAGTPLGRMFANLALQNAQRIEHVVVQVTPEHKRQHDAAKPQRQPGSDALLRRHHPAFEPGKAFPFAALGLKVIFQCTQRNRRRARVAVRPQRKINAKHETVFGDVADQAKDGPDLVRKIFVIGNLATPVCPAGRFAVVVVDIDQVNVAGNIQLARAQLAHADHPQPGAAAVGRQRRAVQGIEHCIGFLHRHI